MLIALIGKDWLTSSDEERQRRIDKRNICVIPVLVDDTSMPKSRDLPDELKALVRRHALEVRHSRFKDDCGRLIVAIERVLETARAQQPQTEVELERVAATAAITSQHAAETPLVSSAPAAPAPTAEGTPATTAEAKLEQFENSLGMRFVPVPIYKGSGSREVTSMILMSQWETWVKGYEAFCNATSHSHEKPSFAQTPDDPVVNVSWEDAKAFCEWLSNKEGRTDRLPTDHEWSCAVGIGDREDPNKSPKEKDRKLPMCFRGESMTAAE